MSRIEKFDILYEPAGETRRIHLYIPDGYDHSDERYPVLYMFDGQNLYLDEDASFGRSWRLNDFMDCFPKKVIVVGMECSHTGNERLREYSPYRIYARWMGSIDGIGDATMQWITNTVKPYIDSHYRTWSHREATAIGGSSMGGMMSLYAIIRYNSVFSKAACVSPAIGFAMRQFRKEIGQSQLQGDTRIFFSWGTDEWKGSDAPMTRNIMSLESFVHDKGATTWLYHQQGGRHNEADWEKQVPTWMQFLWM
ncbi:MAG: hypothetical protein J6I54_06205 [Bacteroidaceae bacterium]|nr:hypothetical protein [Bacteroidaceae bacterium]